MAKHLVAGEVGAVSNCQLNVLNEEAQRLCRDTLTSVQSIFEMLFKHNQ